MQMRQPNIQETDAEKAAKLAAEEQAIEKAQTRAGRETDRLFKLYGGSRSFFGTRAG